jgi:flagellin
MIVRQNLVAENANRYNNINTNSLRKKMEKLSSGYKINRAGDNAAGLAVSEKMRVQIAGITQAVTNAEDGISMLQTFEGALNETHKILDRIKTLSTQSANGIYSDDTDRAAIELEFEQLLEELDDIAETDFNGVQVLTTNTEYIDVEKTREVTKYEADFSKIGTVDISAQLGKSFGDADLAIVGDPFMPFIAELSSGTGKLQLDNGKDITIKYHLDGDSNEFIVDVMQGSTKIGGGSATLNLTDEDYTVELTSADGLTDLGSLTMHSPMGVTIFKETVPVSPPPLRSDFEDQLAAALNLLDDGNASYKVTVLDRDPKYPMDKSTYESDHDSFGFRVSDYTNTIDFGLFEGGASFTVKAFSIDSLKNDGVATADLFGIGNVKVEVVSGTVGNFVDDSYQTVTGMPYASDPVFAERIQPHDPVNEETVSGFAFTPDERTETETYTVKEPKPADPGAPLPGVSLQVGARTKDLKHYDFDYSGVWADAEMSKKAIGELNPNINATAEGLGLVTASVNLSTQHTANKAIDFVDFAINKTSMIRATFGAIQNRLEHKIDNLNVTSENLTAAESRIRDTNVAEEVMELSKAQILSQASQAMLAQANQLPQNVLSLLQ